MSRKTQDAVLEMARSFKLVRYRQEVIVITTPFIGCVSSSASAIVEKILCRTLQAKETSTLFISFKGVEIFRGPIVSVLGSWLNLSVYGLIDDTFCVTCIENGRDVQQRLYLSTVVKEDVPLS